jgi:SAM-dependent methyltransferase
VDVSSKPDSKTRPAATVDPACPSSQLELERRVFSEVNVSGFAHSDQEVAFFTQVAALLRPTDVVLDFGAGRGAWMYEDPSYFRRHIQNFRGRCAHVDGCDIDPIVLENATLDEARTFRPGEALPYEDDRFDIIIARYVFEHIPDPEWAARELLRVLRPGGWICAMTPNKWGYVALAARLLPNRLHARALTRVQPHRKEIDVFPTVYRLNTPEAARRYFGGGGDVFHYTTSAVPSYHFKSMILFRLLLFFHRFLPPRLDVGLRLFIRKHAG